MRYLVTLMMAFFALQVAAQSDDGLLTARRLPLDTTITGAVAFNHEILSCAPGYTFQFVDKHGSNELKYLYEHTNHETLKIEYAYRQKQSQDDTTGKPKPLIFSQRIIADNGTIALIYNCVFGEAVKTDQLEVYSGIGLHFVYREKDYHYTLIPDDYKPGYWVLTFTE